MRRRLQLLSGQAFDELRTTVTELKKAYLLRRLELELTGRFVVGVANAVLKAEAPMNLLRRIELWAGETIQVWDGPSLFVHAMLMNGTMPDRRTPGIVVGNNDFRVQMPLFLEFPKSGYPNLTLMDVEKFPSPELRITWGAATNIAAAGGGGTVALTATRVNVLSNEFYGPGDPGGYGRLYTQKKTVKSVAADSGLVVELPVNKEVRGVLIRVSDDATGEVLSDTKLNKVTVQERGSQNTWDDLNWDQLRSLNQEEFSIAETYETPTDKDGNAAAGLSVQGWGMIDFIQSFGDLVDPRAFGQRGFTLICDVDANTQLDIYTLQVQQS